MRQRHVCFGCLILFSPGSIPTRDHLKSHFIKTESLLSNGNLKIPWQFHDVDFRNAPDSMYSKRSLLVCFPSFPPTRNWFFIRFEHGRHSCRAHTVSPSLHTHTQTDVQFFLCFIFKNFCAVAAAAAAIKTTRVEIREIKKSPESARFFGLFCRFNRNEEKQDERPILSTEIHALGVCQFEKLSLDVFFSLLQLCNPFFVNKTHTHTHTCSSSASNRIIPTAIGIFLLSFFSEKSNKPSNQIDSFWRFYESLTRDDNFSWFSKRFFNRQIFFFFNFQIR